MESSAASSSQHGMMAGSASTIQYSSDDEPLARQSLKKSLSKRDSPRRQVPCSKSLGASARSVSKGQFARKARTVLPLRHSETERGRKDEVAVLRNHLERMESSLDRSQWDSAVQSSHMHGEIAELRGTLNAVESRAVQSTMHAEQHGRVRLLSTEQRAKEEIYRAQTEVITEQARTKQAMQAGGEVAEQVEQLRRQLEQVAAEGLSARRQKEDELGKMRMDLQREWASAQEQSSREVARMRTMIEEERAQLLQEREMRQQVINEAARMSRAWEDEKLQYQNEMQKLAAEFAIERERMEKKTEEMAHALRLEMERKSTTRTSTMMGGGHRSPEHVHAVMAVAAGPSPPEDPGTWIYKSGMVFRE